MPRPSPGRVVAVAAVLSLALVAAGLVTHALDGPTVLQLALAAAAVSVRPLAVIVHRRQGEESGASGYTAAG